MPYRFQGISLSGISVKSPGFAHDDSRRLWVFVAMRKQFAEIQNKVDHHCGEGQKEERE